MAEIETDIRGKRIRQLRNAAGLTQSQVADKLEVSRVAVTKWESGDTANMRIDNLFALADLLGITERELWNGPSRAKKSAEAPNTVVMEPIARYQDKKIATAVKLLEATDDRGRDMAIAGIKVALAGHKSKAKTKRGS